MSWERTHFVPSDEAVFAFFVIFGEFNDEVNISASEYSFTGLPENTEIVKYHDGASPEYRDGYKSGYLWEEFCDEKTELAREINQASSCMVVRVETFDKDSLSYLQNLIGIVTYFLDNGGLCVYEPQRLKWWEATEWRENIFLPNEPQPFKHTIILISEQKNGLRWYHTRGLRLFARPDISVHDVKPEHEDKIHEMINRFIEFQALGGIIEDGQTIDMDKLPSSMWCEHRGNHNDHDFNNKHVEIHWS